MIISKIKFLSNRTNKKKMIKSRAINLTRFKMTNQKSTFTNLFIIRFPFQLLSAQEAVKYFKLSNNHLIVVLNYNNPKKHKAQLKNLIDYDFWDKVSIHEEEKGSNFFKLAKHIKELKKEKYNYVFIKNSFLANDQLLISNIEYKKLILLEDGTITFRLIDRILNNKPLFSFKKKLYRFYLLGLKLKKKYEFELFSMFELPNLKNIKVHKHNFEYLREKYEIESKEKSQDKIFIIGQQHVETKYLSLETYLAFIESIIKKYPNCKITYMMHRKELEEKFKPLTSKYKNLEILKSNTMGEVYFIQLAYQPFIIIGTASTLLFSLKKFFPNLNILSYVFEDNEILAEHEWFQNNYKSFEKEKIKFVKKEDF